MIKTEQRCYNNAVRFLLPLYDFNYIICDDVMEFVGAYTYCPYFPTPECDKLFILYNIIDDKKVKDLTLPNQHNKEIVTINDKLMLIVILNKPQKFSRDWDFIIENNYKETSYECRQKILKSNINKYTSDLLFDTLKQSPDRSGKSKEKFGIEEMLDW